MIKEAHMNDSDWALIPDFYKFPFIVRDLYMIELVLTLPTLAIGIVHYKNTTIFAFCVSYMVICLICYVFTRARLKYTDDGLIKYIKIYNCFSCIIAAICISTLILKWNIHAINSEEFDSLFLTWFIPIRIFRFCFSRFYQNKYLPKFASELDEKSATAKKEEEK